MEQMIIYRRRFYLFSWFIEQINYAYLQFNL